MGKTIQSILGYTGVRAATPPNIVVKNIIPQPTFTKNFKVGDFWLYLPQNVANSSLWVLMSLSAGVADWVEIATGGDVGIFTDFVAITNNSASATAPAELDLIKTRNGGAIVAGDELGCINFVGTDTTPLQIIAASICAVNPATSTIAPNRVAGELQFSTHPDSASGVTPTLRMTISSAGNVTVLQADNDTLGTLSDATFSVVGASIISQSNDNALAATGARAQLTRTRNLGPITTGDRLGTLIFAGYGSDSLPGVGAQIASISVGTIDVNGRIPAGLSFFTHPDAAGPAITERMRIDHIGTVTIFAPTTAAPSLVAARSISAGGDPGAGVASATDLTNGLAVAGGGAGAIALQAGGVGVAQAGWLKFYVNGVVSWVPYYQ